MRCRQAELTAPAAAVMHVLYLIFNEGYTTSSGAHASRVELSSEAIRLTRELYRLRPDDSEVAGLFALMLLTDSRRAARTTDGGELIDLADQDRSRWNQRLIQEGVALITDALARGPLGAYQLQAAIAAVHDEAPRARDTDWPQILALYQLLDRVAPNPMATLGRAVAAAMAISPAAGLEILDGLARGSPDRRPSPLPRRPRPAAGDGRRAPGRTRRVRARRPADRQPAREALPHRPRRRSAHRLKTHTSPDPDSSEPMARSSDRLRL